LEDGEARWEKREESIMCTWRGEEVGAVAQLWRSVLIFSNSFCQY
jgi:NTP pyrophosphatase (non-canonical NTP hydrolase)